MPTSALVGSRTAAASCSMLLLTMVSILRSTSAVVTQDGPLFGLQTGPNAGPLFAGEIVQFDDFLYVTGESYVLDKTGPKDKAACVLIGFDLQQTKITKEHIYGNQDTVNICTSLSVSNPGHLIVTGNSEPSGWVADFESSSSSSTTKMHGILAVLDKETLKKLPDSPTTGITIATTDVTQNIPYPQSVYSDSHGNVWIASLTSTDDTPGPVDSKYPNWLSDKIEYGTSTFMSISKYYYSDTVASNVGDEIMGIEVGTGGLTISKDYAVEYPMDPNSNNGETPRVYIGGIFLKNNHPSASNMKDSDNTNHDREFLIVSGSTRGISEGYGPGAGGDEDGYISILDKDTGRLLDLASDIATAGNLQHNSIRIGTYDDDIIAGICNDWADPNSFFVVGATKGAFDDALTDGIEPAFASGSSLQGFVMKIDIATLSPKWTRQFPAETGAADGSSEAYAMSCVVDSTGHVYVSGNVENSGRMYDAATQTVLDSQRGADIWIAAMNKDSGDVKWMKQVGTGSDDRLAKHGNLAMTHSDDNLIVYGETNGDFYRSRLGDEDDGNTDLFMMALEPATGKHHALEGQENMAPPDDGGGGGDTTNSQEDDDALEFEDNTVGGIDWEPRGTQLAGDLFPGAIVYDSETHNVKFTGGSYLGGTTTSMCFTGSWDLFSGKVQKIYHSGTPTTEEACNAISWSPFEDKSYAVGFTEAVDGGMFDYMVVNDPSSNYKVLGTILQTDANGEPVGGAVIQDENVQYPVAVVTHPSEDYIFVASSSSDSTAQNANATPDSAHPDLTTGGKNRKYGDNFFVSIAKYDVLSQPDSGADPLEETMDQSWYKSFNTADAFDAAVSGMVLAGSDASTLVVVGSTKGSGSIFGEKSGTDWDGFLLKLDAASGSEIGDVTDGERTASRIDSSDKKDDWVNGICVDKFNPNAIFLVGGTKGKIRTLDQDHQLPEGDIHSYIVKIELDTLDIIWIKHFTMQSGPGSVTAEAAAFSCVVAPGEGSRNAVYIAGTILDGAYFDGSEEGKSAGGDDIFVIQMDDDGEKVNWIRQIGTDADDRLATTGGIDVDLEGNVIVFGETKGAFYSVERSGKNDLVAFTMSKKDGSYHSLGSGAPPVVDAGGNSVEVSDNNGDGMEDIAIVAPEEDDDDDDVANDTEAEAPDTILAIQSGPDAGPSYAGGMVYDKSKNAIYMTGATYGSFDRDGDSSSATSNCFFGEMMLPSLEWKHREVYGTAEAPEACSSIDFTHHKRHSYISLIGSTEANGLLTSNSQQEDSQYSLVMDVFFEMGEYEFVGGAIVDDEEVQFPAAVHTNGDIVYVASMSSSNKKLSADFEKASKEYPNFTTGGIEKYGSEYNLVLEAFDVERKNSKIGTGVMQQSYVRKWRKSFDTGELSSVFVSGLVEIGDDLIVVGSTRAKGEGNDMDGVMAKVNHGKGHFDESGGKAVGYFESVFGADDWIMHACQDAFSENHFYIVGATASKAKDSNTLNAFAAKVTVEDLSLEWVNEIEVLHASGDSSKHAAAIALGCHVVPGSNFLYVGGTVENGARLNYDGLESAGRDDIFVAKMQRHAGTTIWMNQIGSNGEDRLARGGGISSDENGNAVIYGDTNGDFFRWNPERNSDVFVLLADKDTGYTQAPFRGNPFSSDTSAPREWFGELTEEKKNTVWKILGACLAVAVFVLCYCRRRTQRKRAESQKSSIFAYLQKFDVEDVDLRKSPPGGWHGTYLNKLAYGINKSETAPYGDLYNEFEARPLTTHSSVVSDSLFMDAASTPSLEYSDTPASYDDLLDKYRDGSEGRPGMEII